MANGIMDFNALGIAFVSDDIPNKKAGKIYKKMDEIIEKYESLAQEELDNFLEKQGFESAMGVVIKKKNC